MNLAITSLDGSKKGKVELSAFIFGLAPRADILHRMVRYQLARRRAGTHKVKGRSDVIGSMRKIHAQKGTGNARHSTRKANLFRGGGVTHGPHPRDHSHKLPKKFRALALRHALSAKAQAGELVVLDSVQAGAPKTGALCKQLENIGLIPALIIDREKPENNFALASRNIPGVAAQPIEALNVYSILRCKKLALTKNALNALNERFQPETGK